MLRTKELACISRAEITAKAAPLKITEQPKDIEDASYENRNDVWCNVTGGEGDRTYTWEYDLDGVWLPIDRSMKEFTVNLSSIVYFPIFWKIIVTVPFSRL